MSLQWQTLDMPAWQRLKRDNTLVEADTLGPKVFRCPDGDYIKVFRRKHRVTLVNPALRFCRNASRLRALGIATPTPRALFHIPKGRWAVRYAPLAGDTLRDLLRRFAMPEHCIAALGRLMWQLHERGICFRSLHPGNVVLQPNGELGLIDVLDCQFRWFGRPLSAAARERNFRHFFRYEDGQLLEAGVRAAYKAAQLT